MSKKNLNVRWLYLTAGVLALLFAGIIYGWSILKAPLAADFGWTADQLALNFTLTMCFFCLGGMAGGLLWELAYPGGFGGQVFYLALAGMAALIGIAFFYAICKSRPAVDFKNSMDGFLRYFQAERFYWLYPALWYLEFALVFGFLWKMPGAAWYKTAALILVLFPTLNLIRVNSLFYMNINQINNGSGVTGYISWESFYSEDLMQRLEDAIGKEMSSYRVAHLGISPAPALMHGFYTVDGYSNNYPLAYKHRFRQVIAGELARNEEARVYFDCWGSRCYLFNSVTGTYWMLRKDSGVQYEDLAFDLDALKALGCQYLFSGAQIADAEEMGLTFSGYFDTEDSYWGIWLYELAR